MYWGQIQSVPSFAPQDFRRIRSIHADLASSTIFKQYKAKVDMVVKEYSETVARYTEFQNLKIRLQSDLYKALVYSRSIVSEIVSITMKDWSIL